MLPTDSCCFQTAAHLLPTRPGRLVYNLMLQQYAMGQQIFEMPALLMLQQPEVADQGVVKLFISLCMHA